jgi:hypothetical protein
MKTLPQKCKNVNSVGAFCNCISGEEAVDAAAHAFCKQANTGSEKNASGENLADLKKALLDLEN